VEVEGTDLHELLDPAPVQPRSERSVQLGAVGLRKPRIGDLADEDVLEPERVLAGDRGARLPLDEIPYQQRVERLVDIADAARELLDRTPPEHPSDHRRALK